MVQNQYAKIDAVPGLRWQTVVDFLVLAAALYAVLKWARQARALRIALGIVGLHIGAILARHFELFLTGWLLDGAAVLAIVLLVVVFRSEARHAMLQLDSLLRPRPAATAAHIFRAIAKAAFSLAESRTGALIVIVRRDETHEFVQHGVALDAELSSELIESIFQKTSPLHDGAVVVSGERLVRANAVLPLTDSREVPASYGTRHRAAMGLAERCDALITVVSEERGEVTLIRRGKIDAVASAQELVRELQHLATPPPKTLENRLRRAFFSDLGFKWAAFGLAALVWVMSVFVGGVSVRTLSAPIEFNNVPAGMFIADQSVDRLDIQLRGSSWLMDSFSLPRLTVQFDLRGLGPGRHRLTATADNVNLPPAIVMERIVPAYVTILLVRQK